MEFNLCACMGKIGNDPYCPCEMKNRGLEPTKLWTPEKIAELNNVFATIFDKRLTKKENNHD
jgi:hypothetical protein